MFGGGRTEGLGRAARVQAKSRVVHNSKYVVPVDRYLVQPISHVGNEICMISIQSRASVYDVNQVDGTCRKCLVRALEDVLVVPPTVQLGASAVNVVGHISSCFYLLKQQPHMNEPT